MLVLHRKRLRRRDRGGGVKPLEKWYRNGWHYEYRFVIDRGGQEMEVVKRLDFVTFHILRWVMKSKSRRGAGRE